METITYKEISNPNGVDLEQLEKLEKAIFKKDATKNDTPARLPLGAVGRKNVLAHIAFSGDAPIAFKLGYERTYGEFYSWLGGVLPDWRRQGIAQKLLLMQHATVQSLGYQKITTKSRNQFPQMLILNIKNGFRIVGTQLRDEGKDLSILFEKTF